MSWSCQVKTQDSVSSACDHDILQPYNVFLCNRNITAFKVISIVLSCLTIYLLLGTYIFIVFHNDEIRRAIGVSIEFSDNQMALKW